VSAQFRFSSSISKIFLIATLSTGVTVTPVSAVNIATPASVGLKAGDQASSDLIEVRGGRGGGGHRGGGGGRMHAGGGGRMHAGGGGRMHAGGGGRMHAGGAGVGRHTNVVRNRTVVGARGGWARPYRWPRGGAIAAGAAIGFVTAATAAAWAGAPPASGMCWYYTDPSRTQGFWDYCQ
jgi:hypothetical protein